MDGSKDLGSLLVAVVAVPFLQCEFERKLLVNNLLDKKVFCTDLDIVTGLLLLLKDNQMGMMVVGKVADTFVGSLC